MKTLLRRALALAGVLCCAAALLVGSSDGSLGRFGFRLPETILVGGRRVEVDESLDRNELEEAHFSVDASGEVTYSGESLRGIDLSSHQGEVRWSEVAADGVEFAMLRIGYRGYSEEGGLHEDERFQENLSGALENGLSVGGYFFSQALTAEEAEEEAEFVLTVLNGAELTLPIAYDWEPIEGADARTDGLDAETVTACALAFCEVIQNAGYECVIYCNGELGYFVYDLAEVQEYDLWYAEYSTAPTFAYRFILWQYSNTGSVAGIDGAVDLNLWFPAAADSEEAAEVYGEGGEG